jgi:hypothetical protein
MKRIREDWTPTMEQRAGLEGRQVKCLIASEGHLWMTGFFDRLPSAVRQRLMDNCFNICPACFTEQVQRQCADPTLADYSEVLAAIEQRLAAEKAGPIDELDEIFPCPRPQRR